jgi:hypothetical protein
MEPRGLENRSVKVLFTKNVEVRLEDGSPLRGDEALFDEGEGTVTLTLKIK